MMDGQGSAIRYAPYQDDHEDVPILAYAAKYASALDGPFRDAVDVTIVAKDGKGGDRKGYQQDPANVRESMEEMEADLAEGDDMLMVKPAPAYIDVISRTRSRFDVPLAAYHVSGEYAMVKAAGERGWIDDDAVIRDDMHGTKRAGPALPTTYAARKTTEH